MERFAVSAGLPRAKEGIGAMPFVLKLIDPENFNGFLVLSDSSLEKEAIAEVKKIKISNPLIKIPFRLWVKNFSQVTEIAC